MKRFPVVLMATLCVAIRAADGSADGVVAFTAAPPMRTDGVVWESKSRTVNASLGERQAVVEFTGTCVVDGIRSLSAEHTCGCMDIAVAPEAPRLADACVVRVSIDLDTVPADTVKTVRLRTTLADGRVETTRLDIRITMPAAIAIDPSAIYWDPSEALTAKSAVIRPLVDGVVVSARVDNASWRIAVAPDGSAVSVEPLQRAQDVPEDRRSACRYAMCRLTARMPSGASKEYILWGVQRE